MADRTRTERDALEWVLVALGFTLAVIHFYLGFVADFVTRTEARQFTFIGVVFLVGVIFYFSPYWRPIGYLLGTLFAFYLGLLWFLGGMRYLIPGVVTGVIATCFAILTVYLFVRSERLAAKRAQKES